MVKNLKVNVDDKLQSSLRRKGIDVELGECELTNWQVLKSTSYRTLKIEVVCDECKNSKFIMLKNANINLDHICKSCNIKGDKNPAFGKPSKAWAIINKEIREGIRSNPFSIKEINRKAVLTKINNPDFQWGMKNKTHSLETRDKMSKTRKEKIKSGEIEIKAEWKVRDNYKGELLYQSTYELHFLEYMESKGLLSSVKRGPKIPYLDNDKKRNYFSDFLIEKLNLVVEIKSTWVLDNNNMIYKEIGVRENGYNFLMILDKNYESLEKLINDL